MVMLSNISESLHTYSLKPSTLFIVNTHVELGVKTVSKMETVGEFK